MSDLLKIYIAVFGTSIGSVLGSIAIKAAAGSGNLPLAIVGSALWSLGGAGFAYAAMKDIDLGILAGATSAAGLLLANAIAFWWFGEPMTVRKAAALICIMIALILLSLPAKDQLI